MGYVSNRKIKFNTTIIVLAVGIFFSIYAFFFRAVYNVKTTLAAVDTFYVDNSLGGNCSGNYSIANRTCTGSDGNAYTTIAAAVSAASAGDTINIRQGTYSISSAINISLSSATLTTTIQSYNSEAVTIANSNVGATSFNTASANNLLIKDLKFTGTPYYVISSWSNYSGNVWSATIPYSTTQVRFDTTNGTDAGSIGAVDASNEYYITGSTIYAYSVGDPSTTYTSPGINLADNFAGIAIGNPSGTAGNLITVDHCEFEDFSHVAIKGAFRWHIKNSIFNNNGTDFNDHHIYATGVQTAGNEAIIEHNYFGYTPGAAIHLFSSPAYTIVRYNVMNGLSGSNRAAWGVLLAGANHSIYNNTMYGNDNAITLYKSTSQNNVIKNNILSNNNNDISVDTGGPSYPTNNTVESNYLGSTSKCYGCSDYTGSGGPDLSTLDDAPPNFYSSSPWTQFTYNITSTGNTSLQFFNNCNFSGSSTTGIWYLDDISVVPVGGGAEEVTNGDMEGSFSGGIASGWAVAGGATGAQETSIVHSGSNSQKITLPGGCGARFETWLGSFTAGDYVLTGWAKRETGTATIAYGTSNGNSYSTVGRIGPDFLGTAPFDEVFDLKVDSAEVDIADLVNNGENLGVSNATGFDSTSTDWPLSTTSQNSYGGDWDLGAFVYANTPTTSDNINSNPQNTDVTVTLTCTPDGSLACTNTYYTTDGTDPTIASTQGTSFTLSDEGAYTVKYFSVDELGTEEIIKTASNQVKIFTSPPTTTDNVPSEIQSSSVTVTLSCSGANSLSCANTYYTTDGTDPTLGSKQGDRFTLTGEGTYTVKYFSVDELGNQESIKTAANQLVINKSSGGSSNTTTVNNIVCGKIDIGGKTNFLDVADFANFAKKYGKTCTDISANFTGCGNLDTDGNGKINLVDFASFSYRFGKSCI
ncbi:chitobiase/beta-hexosaminidase C-terminal domain-containing protein [Candidatus Dojkabacteria bacterium]|uniref:Probable pectate lyase C n=1 Tax=Candidatus Dojkabacteria bacterium TaxID=2099670 RepID=A0A955L2W1_9BACT|nr:chitobiase/beta-hexosaminidase C-terminal domain-containing protein [Candidatus Dojkabacteria bacterium]